MALFARLDRLLRQISYIGFLAASALLLIVGLMGAADVVSTNLFLKPISGLVELSGSLLAVIVFLGLAEAQARGSNIVIDVATQGMGQTTRLALNSWAIRETALGALAFPVAPFKSVAAFGGWLAAAEFARQLLRLLAGAEVSTDQKDDRDA